MNPVKKPAVPSEREWLIMEAVWDAPETGLTSAEIIKTVSEKYDVSEKTIRVLLTRLIGKELLRTETDAFDSRVYHYFALKDRHTCLKLKSEQFVESFFKGSKAGAVAAFLEDATLTDSQIAELQAILDAHKGRV